jgi:plasmid stability protein
MANVLVRDLPDEIHVELKARAKKNARSVNAEIRAVLGAIVPPKARMGLGSQIEEFKKKLYEEGDDFTFEVIRDKTPATGVDFSGPEYDWPEPQ